MKLERPVRCKRLVTWSLGMLLGALSCVASADELQPQRLSTGDFEVLWKPGDPAFSIRRLGAAGTQGALRWTPGGQSAALPVLSPQHLEVATREADESGRSLTLRGRLDWATYSLGVQLPADTPGLLHLWLEVTPSLPGGPQPSLFADGGPELSFARDDGEPLDPEAQFYFETPVPHAVKIWDWRTDLNQFLFFGDRQVLDASLLYYTDFTALNDYFLASGTRMFQRIRGWEYHDDIVARPAGAWGTPPQLPFRFGLQMPAPKRELAAGHAYRVSDAWLHLVPGVFSPQDACQTSQRFLQGYAALFGHVKKPEIQMHPWQEWTATLVRQLNGRHDPNWGYWTLAGPHFNLLPFLDYFACFDPAQNERLQPMARRQLLPAFAPDYVNDHGSRGGYGWYRTREEAAKSDFWQGYLWPLYIATEYALAWKDNEVREMVLKLPPVLLDTGRRLDYTFAVFVNLNSATNVDTGYDYDYGAAGLYAALMLQYHRLTGDAQYLEEAQKAARKLTSFGFASGFEMHVPALSALTLLRLHQLTGDAQYLEGSYVQLAVILKHTWLFNPRYERFQGRDLFALTSARANLIYANGAEEGMMMRFLCQYLEEGQQVVDRRIQALLADVLRYKAHAWVDALPAAHADKSLIHLDKPENWDPIQPDSCVPMEPFGYNLDDKKLGFLNECIYGCNLLAEAALMQFHPLGDRATLYTEGPVVLERRTATSWSLRALGTARPIPAALQSAQIATWTMTVADGQPRPVTSGPQAWQSLEVPPDKTCLLEVSDPVD